MADHEMYRRPVPDRVIEVTGPQESPPPATDRPRWSRGMRMLAVAVVALLVLGVAAVAAMLPATDHTTGNFSGVNRPAPDGPADPAGEPDPAAQPADEATAPLDGRRQAVFELVDGVTTLSLRTDDLGDRLYRISSPPEAGVVPAPKVFGDQVHLHVGRSGREGPGVVDVVLHSGVTWQLKITGGVDEQVLDLSRGRSAGVELVGGASRTELRLPDVAGTLTVRMSGGVGDLLIRSTGDQPARVRAGSGAATIRVYEHRRTGVAAGTVVGSPDWDRVDDRLWVDLVAGANSVTVTGS
ncbi:hypothetical protein ABT336_22340 [Micromonospora sp. NPDC000207]|uniref:hypothetical protein n=1 Tax=Micromonospora sp. NPDC000207 TaxID=3154246 RepID=UPI00331F0E52